MNEKWSTKLTKYYLCNTYIMPMSSKIKSIAKNALLIEANAVAWLEQYWQKCHYSAKNGCHL